MIIYSIYCITNHVTRKSYVGFSADPKKRFHAHSYNPPKNLISKSFRKYGKKNHTQEILYQSHDREHCRDMETHFIQELNTHFQNGTGYNMTFGGEGELGNKSRTNKPHTPKSIQKMSETKKGKLAWNRTSYIITHDNGETFHIDTLSEVRKYGLNPNTMKATLRRPWYRFNGWKLIKACDIPL